MTKNIKQAIHSTAFEIFTENAQKEADHLYETDKTFKDQVDRNTEQSVQRAIQQYAEKHKQAGDGISKENSHSRVELAINNIKQKIKDGGADFLAALVFGPAIPIDLLSGDEYKYKLYSGEIKINDKKESQSLLVKVYGKDPSQVVEGQEIQIMYKLSDSNSEIKNGSRYFINFDTGLIKEIYPTNHFRKFVIKAPADRAELWEVKK